MRGMAKILLLLGVVGLVLWIFRASRGGGANGEKPAASAKLARCPRCGVYRPRDEPCECESPQS